MSSQLFSLIDRFIDNIVIDFFGQFLLQKDFLKLFRLSKEFARLRKQVKNIVYVQKGYVNVWELILIYVEVDSKEQINFFGEYIKKIKKNYPYLVFNQNLTITMETDLLKLIDTIDVFTNLFYSVKINAVFEDDYYFYYLVDEMSNKKIIEEYIKHIQKIKKIFPHLVFKLNHLQITNETDTQKLFKIIDIQKNLFYSVDVDFLEFNSCEKNIIENFVSAFLNIKINKIRFNNYKIPSGSGPTINHICDNICDISFLKVVEQILFDTTISSGVNKINLDFLPPVKKIIFEGGTFKLDLINSKFVAEELELDIYNSEFFFEEYTNKFELFKKVKKIILNGVSTGLNCRFDTGKNQMSVNSNFQSVKEIVMYRCENLAINFLPKLKKITTTNCYNISINRKLLKFSSKFYLENPKTTIIIDDCGNYIYD